MNIRADQIERIKELGYTEAEARFIYLVAIHSGYFTLRQFLNFTQAKRGKRSNAFAQKLLKHGHATMRDYMGAGSVFIYFPGPFTARSRKTTSATAANIRLISSVRGSSFWTSS